MPIQFNTRSKHISQKNILRLALFGIVYFLLTACSTRQFEQGPNRITDFELCSINAGQTIGQTFVAHERGFNGVQFFLQWEQQGSGRIIMHLQSEPGDSEDIRTSVLPQDQVHQAGFYLFNFDQLTNSRQQYYYAYLELEGDSTLSSQCLPGDAYIDGAMHRDHQPQDAQLNFKLAYDRTQALIGLGMETIKWGGILGIGILLYVVPGTALLLALWPDSKLPIVAQASLGIGISLAIYPILMLWTDLIGLHLGSLYAWIPVVLGGLYLLWRLIHLGLEGIKRKWQRWRQSGDILPDLILILLLGLVFLSRFYAVRMLDVPMWGDSYQHTMIAQLIVDNGGLFDSWEPYAPLTSFTYHFGFHSDVAVFEWITDRSAIRSTLWVGQILNGLAILALYPLALKIGKSKWAGLVAILIAGLLSPMPNSYANWGRYTQLAGLCILPIAIFLAWVLIEKEIKSWKLFFIGWILFAGLALTHYRVLIFALPFFFVIIFQNLQPTNIKPLVIKISLLALGGIIIFLPWLVHIFPSATMQRFMYFISTPADSTTTFVQQYNQIGKVENYLPIYIWILLIISIGHSLWRNNRNVLTMLLWWTLILLLANPDWLGLPGTGAISNFAVFISIYVFSAILIGEAYAWALQSLQKSWIQAILIGTILILIPYGLVERQREIDQSSFSLVTNPDLRAAAWIQENTTSDSQFLVNGFFAYGGTTVVGSDGGWWLPMTARRGNTVPPINYTSEEGDKSDYLDYVNDLYNTLQVLDITDTELIHILKARGITHVFIGQHQGRVNYSGPRILQPDIMAQDKNYDLIYHADRVWIFVIR